MLDAQEKAMRLFVTDPDLCWEIGQLLKAKNRDQAPRLRTGLTHKQHELYEFLHEFMDANDGVAPSFDEMKEAIGLASKSGIYRLLTGLEERGHIQRLPNKARAIILTSNSELISGAA